MEKVKRIKIGLVAMLTAGAMCFSSLTVLSASGETLYEKVQKDRDTLITYTEDVYYTDYLNEHRANGASDYKGDDIEISVKDASVSEGKVLSVENTSDRDGVSKEGALWREENFSSIEWQVEITEPGFYNIEVDYLSVKSNIIAAQRALYINDEQPFKEMNVIYFYRQWSSDGEIWVNSMNDQVRPQQKEDFVWMTNKVSDSSGKYNLPLLFYLKEGTNKIRFEYYNEPMVISDIKLTAPKTYKKYSEVLEEYRAKGYTEYSNVDNPIRVEGHEAIYKSDPSIRIQSDPDPKIIPKSEGNIVFNTIGGDAWKTGNQSITWEVPVEQSGLYKISMRSVQMYTDGLPVYRKIMVDGEVPYEEFLSYEIEYNDWNFSDISDSNGEPYLIYLEEGVHTFTMQVNCGKYADIISQLEQNAYRLSSLVQKIIKVTTIDPDVNFDYKLDAKIPGLMEEFQELSDAIQKQVDDISGLSNKRPGAINNLLMVKSQIDTMLADPFKIARGFKELMDSQSTMATWISDFQRLPLLIDFISFQAPSAETKNIRSNFFQKFATSFKSFMLSFTKDYDSVGRSFDGSEDAETIEVWVSRAKEWTEVLQYMSDEEFTRNKGINIKMTVVPAGTFNASGLLMMAVASGTSPDVALGVSSEVPFEYGIRDAIYDLKQFDDYDEIEARFLPGIMTPFLFEGQSFALPETMDFTVMFYRKDILAGLELEIPDTWDELFSRIQPLLAKSGMTFYYDGTPHHNFLYQHNGRYYTDDGRKSALDEPEGIAAFKQFTELYTIYGMPVTADIYTRFRAGQIPIGISTFGTYVKFVAAAPEINGKWDVAPIPGVLQADGQINRSYGGGTTAAMILGDTDSPDASWEFLKWFTSKDTQVRYSNDIMTTVGEEARWCSANIEAFDNIAWESSLKNVIQEQRQWYQDKPNVIGGYITARYIENARVRTVVQGRQYRDSLEFYNKEINIELENKYAEITRRRELEASKK